MIEFNIDDAGDHYEFRVACPCGALHQPTQVVDVARDCSPGELGRRLNAAELELRTAFTDAHPDGIVCKACGEHSDFADAPIRMWTAPALKPAESEAA
jgi:hypothetical protein